MKQNVILGAKGAAMGIADSIPGVSGGTMALILGIYERFITALNAIGPALLPMLLKGAFYRNLWRAIRPGGQPDEDPIGVAAGHIGFLVNLAVGIIAGLLVGVAALPVLMERYPDEMRGFFFGLVAASIIIPYGFIREHKPIHIGIFILLCVGTFLLMGLQKSVSGFATTTVTIRTADGAPLKEDRTIGGSALQVATDTGQKKLRRELSFQAVEDLHMKAGESSWSVRVMATQAGERGNVAAGSLMQVVDPAHHTLYEGLTVTQPEAAGGGSNPAVWYLFICGAIAICAMMLPGISGAFLLLMLGVYGYVLGSIRAIVYTRDMGPVPALSIFVVGVLLGLVLFSRFLKWLLARYHDNTMAALSGLMLGSLRALWPFKAGVGKYAENALPSGFDSHVAIVIGVALFGAALVLALNHLGRRAETRLTAS